MPNSAPRRPFEFIANHIVLDFTNTVNARPQFSRDDLRSAADVADWALAAGLLDRQSGGLASGTDRSAGLDGVVALRESLYGVFGPIARDEEPTDEALTILARYTAEAMRASHLARADGAGYVTTWTLNSFDSLAHFLADEAMQLLRSPAVDRIGSCDGCGWLFLDTSRAGARRWCSMNVCGARHKMRRYHERQAGASSAA